MDHQRIIRDVTADLPAATTALDACQRFVTALARHTPAAISLLLQVQGRLRCVAATGAWQIFSTVPPKTGIVGRVYATGETAVVPDVAADPDHLPIRPDVTAEICVPVVDPAERAVGVLDLQWSAPVDLQLWRATAERLAARKARRQRPADEIETDAAGESGTDVADEVEDSE
ncbi:GAF domain-containing protein [Micromonospora azadirachtae]|uniref:GAF domain-containing protein n=1 Tax=Micromonospora azadirachtae TaxID=1970735 RepID=A0ABW2ZZ97_9ACTN